MRLATSTLILLVVLPLGCSSGDRSRTNPTTAAPVATNTAPVASAVVVRSLSPDRGQAGNVIVVSGDGFAAATTDNHVTFAGVAATVLLTSPTDLLVEVPTGALTGPVQVQTPQGTAQGPTFTIVGSSPPLPPVPTTPITSPPVPPTTPPTPPTTPPTPPATQAPAILSVVPARAVPGETLLILGTDFDPTAAGNVFTFPGGVTATPRNGWASRGHAYVQVPAGVSLGAGGVTLTALGRTSGAAALTVEVRPRIDRITPNSALVGQEIVIEGIGHYGLLDDVTVRFSGGVSAKPHRGGISATGVISITVTVPVGARTGPIETELAGLYSNTYPLTVLAPPAPTTPTGPAATVTNVLPPTAAPGELVLILGTGFDPTGTNSVEFPGARSLPTPGFPLGSTALYATVPLGATTGAGNVAVTVNGAPGRSFPIGIAAAPRIDRVTPTLARVGDTLRIEGIGLGLVYLPQLTVRFGGGVTASPQSGGVTANGSQYVTVQVPAGALSGPAWLELAGQRSNQVQLTLSP